MKQMKCPLNGWRNIAEFSYGGEVEHMPDLANTSNSEWAKHIYFHENTDGICKEWWCHTATSYWFIAERNTINNEIIATYPSDKIFTSRVEFT